MLSALDMLSGYLVLESYQSALIPNNIKTIFTNTAGERLYGFATMRNSKINNYSPCPFKVGKMYDKRI